MKDELALEAERWKKAEAEVTEGKKWVAEAKKQAILDFKASRELEDIKIEFTKKAFGRDFNLCQQKIDERIFDLDLDFLLDGP